MWAGFRKQTKTRKCGTNQSVKCGSTIEAMWECDNYQPDWWSQADAATSGLCCPFECWLLTENSIIAVTDDRVELCAWKCTPWGIIMQGDLPARLAQKDPWADMRQHCSTAEKKVKGHVVACSVSQTDWTTSVQNPTVCSISEFQLLTEDSIAVVTSNSVELCVLRCTLCRIVVHDVPTRLAWRHQHSFASWHKAAQRHCQEETLGLCYAIFIFQYNDGSIQTDGVTICSIYNNAKYDFEYASLDNEAMQVLISANQLVSKRLTKQIVLYAICILHRFIHFENFRCGPREPSIICVQSRSRG